MGGAISEGVEKNFLERVELWSEVAYSVTRVEQSGEKLP